MMASTRVGVDYSRIFRIRFSQDPQIGEVDISSTLLLLHFGLLPQKCKTINQLISKSYEKTTTFLFRFADGS